MSSQKSKRKTRRKRAVARRLRYLEIQNSILNRPVMLSTEVHPDAKKYRHILLGETCEYCKHWNNVEPIRGYCKSDKLYEGDGSIAPIDGVWYGDYESYLETGKDFGCIHFEQWEDKS